VPGKPPLTLERPVVQCRCRVGDSTRDMAARPGVATRLGHEKEKKVHPFSLPADQNVGLGMPRPPRAARKGQDRP